MKSEIKKHRIALFGMEQHFGCVLSDVETSQYVLHCVAKTGVESLTDFDSLIIMQGAFEELHRTRSFLGETEWISCDTDELDRRTKEVIQIFKKGGLVLVLLVRPFYDSFGGRNCKDTDLAKRLINTQGLYRYDLESPAPCVFPMKGELEEFCERYGRAYSYFDFFRHENDHLDYLPLVKLSSGKIVGFSLYRRLYYLPAILPKNNNLEEFLAILTGSAFAIYKKSCVELPSWVNKISLGEEAVLRGEIENAEKVIRDDKVRLERLIRFKRVLIESGDDLVNSVAKLINEITEFQVDSIDNKKEDCRIIDKAGNVIALVEIKGMNGNVKMSNVSQAFEHRERTQGFGNLPVILIVNTFIGTARSEYEKDKAPEEEQIHLAEKHKVLILRTIDLLRMYNAVSLGSWTKERIGEYMLTRVGWSRFEETREGARSCLE